MGRIIPYIYYGKKCLKPPWHHQPVYFVSISLFQWCIMTIKILQAQAIHHSSSFHGHTLPILTYEHIYQYSPRVKLTPRGDDSAPKKDLRPRILRSLLAAENRICSKKAQLNIFQVDEYSAFFSVSPWFLGKTIKHGKTILFIQGRNTLLHGPFAKKSWLSPALSQLGIKDHVTHWWNQWNRLAADMFSTNYKWIEHG